MRQAFQNYIIENNLCVYEDKILVAVSGGLDSLVMLHLFRECEFNFGVAHVNFQLRGSESESDESFVKTICQKKSIPFFSTRFETENYAQENNLSIQMAARKLRYEWFSEVMQQQHYDFIATAHHLNDSIETVLLNLVRGSGLEGWDGITAKNGKIIRPLMFATRQQIETYAKENRIEWREDQSNATDVYSRNFIRHQVVPKLKEINPSFERSFLESIRKISGANELMSLGIERWKEMFEIQKGEQLHMAKEGFSSFKNPENVLWNLIKGYGFHFDQCAQIVELINGQSGKKFFSSFYELVIDRENLILSKLKEVLGETLIESGQTEARIGNFKLKIERKDKTSFIDDPSLAVLDASKLIFPLRWRKWNPGDSFYPLGMNHKKKLSDFLIDQKISLPDKETVTVLESGNEIVWVVGMRVDNRYKINESTKSIMACQLSTIDR